MGGYLILNKENKVVPVHNLATGLYLVRVGEAISVIDPWSGRAIK